MTGKVGGGFSHGDLTVQPAPSNTEWWETPGRMEDLEQWFKPDGLLRLARSTQEYYDSHGHYLPGVAALALRYHTELTAARAEAERLREALAMTLWMLADPFENTAPQWQNDELLSETYDHYLAEAAVLAEAAPEETP